MIPKGFNYHRISEYLVESRINGTNGEIAKKLTVKLYGKGVFLKKEGRKGSPNTKYFRRKKGQFIYSKLDFLNGAFGIIPVELDGLESTLDLPAFDFIGEINPEYFYFYVSRPSFYEAQNGVAKGGRKARRISPSEFLKLSILLPPLSVQNRIVSVIKSNIYAINSTQKVIDKLQKIKRGLLQDFYCFGDYEKDLSKKKLSELVLLDDLTSRGSGHTPNKKNPEYWNGGIKWISLSDSKKLDKVYISTTEKKISAEGILNSSATIHKADSVVISRDAGVGKSAILKYDMAVSQHFVVWTCTNKLNPLYLYFWLQYMKPIFEEVAIGSTIKTIGMPFFKNLRIPYIERNKQDRIVKVLLSIEESSRHMTDKKKQLIKINEGLIEDLLTGKTKI